MPNPAVPSPDRSSPPPSVSPSPAAPAFDVNPQHASSWFERANNTASPLGVRLYYWLAGVQADCTNAQELRGFLTFLRDNPLTAKQHHEGTSLLTTVTPPVGIYVRALAELSRDPKSYTAALSALENCAKLRIEEPLKALGEYTIRALKEAGDKPSKKREPYINAIELFRKQGALALALRAATELRDLFPQDTVVSNLYRSVSAEHTVVAQLLDQEGGFRRNVRDPALQQQLERDGRLAQTDASLDDQLRALEETYSANPTDSLVVEQYVKLLRLRGANESLEKAIVVLDRAYGQTKSSGYRKQAVDLRVRLLEAKLRQEENGSDTSKEALRAQICALKSAEWAERVREEPQNSLVRVEYGQLLLEQDKPLEALQHLQTIRDGEHVGAACEGQLRAFASLHWWPEFVTRVRLALMTEKGLGKSHDNVVALISKHFGDIRDGDEIKLQCGRQLVAELLIRNAADPAVQELRSKLYRVS